MTEWELLKIYLIALKATYFYLGRIREGFRILQKRHIFVAFVWDKLKSVWFFFQLFFLPIIWIRIMSTAFLSFFQRNYNEKKKKKQAIHSLIQFLRTYLVSGTALGTGELWWISSSSWCLMHPSWVNERMNNLWLTHRNVLGKETVVGLNRLRISHRTYLKGSQCCVINSRADVTLGLPPVHSLVQGLP